MSKLSALRKLHLGRNSLATFPEQCATYLPPACRPPPPTLLLERSLGAQPARRCPKGRNACALGRSPTALPPTAPRRPWCPRLCALDSLQQLDLSSNMITEVSHA